MTSGKPEGYDPDEQEGFDEYVPDLVDAINLGYFDAHLKVVARALFTRRGVIEGVDYSVPIKRRPAGVPRNLHANPAIAPKPHADAGSMGKREVEVTPGVVLITVTDPNTGGEVRVGKIVTDRDGTKHKVKEDKFSPVPDWYDRTIDVEGKKYRKDLLPNEVLEIGKHELVPTAMLGQCVKIEEVGRKTVNVRILTFPKYPGRMRSNSVFRKAWDKNALLKLPIEVFSDYFE